MYEGFNLLRFEGTAHPREDARKTQWRLGSDKYHQNPMLPPFFFEGNVFSFKGLDSNLAANL